MQNSIKRLEQARTLLENLRDDLLREGMPDAEIEDFTHALALIGEVRGDLGTAPPDFDNRAERACNGLAIASNLARGFKASNEAAYARLNISADVIANDPHAQALNHLVAALEDAEATYLELIALLFESTRARVAACRAEAAEIEAEAIALARLENEPQMLN